MSKGSAKLIVGLAVVVMFCVMLGAKGKRTVKPMAGVEPASPKALPVLLDFGRGQCIPCKMMKPILDALAKELDGKVEVKIIDVGEEPEKAYQFGIRLIPTQVFLDATGKEIYRHEGFMGKEEILAILKEKGVM